MRPQYHGGEPGVSYDGQGNKEFDSAEMRANRKAGAEYLKNRAKQKGETK